MDNITEALNKQIKEDFDDIARTAVDSEQRERSTANLVQLYRLRLEEQKLQQEREQQVWANRIKTAIDIAGLIVPNGIALYSVMKVMRFETEGVLKTSTSRRVIGWIRPVTKMFK